MGGVFVGWLGRRRPFRERWDDEGLMPPALIPCAGVGDLSVTLLPQLRFLAPAYRGKTAPGTTGRSVRPMGSSRRRVCAPSSSRHWSPLTTVIPRTSTCGD